MIHASFHSAIAFCTWRMGSSSKAPTRSEERRVGKECRSRCDWSSDVCSPIYDQGSTILIVAHDSRIIPFCDRVLHLEDGILFEGADKIGRASCRERV